MNKNILSGLAIAAALTVSSATAYAKNDKELYNPNVTPLTIVNTISDVHGGVAGFLGADGQVNGNMMDPTNTHIVYPISGDVYATVTDDDTGESQGAYENRGTIHATVMFSTSFFGLLQYAWGDLPATLDWTMTNELTDQTNPYTQAPFNEFEMEIDGTTFTFVEGLTGRAFPHLGPVENPAVSGKMALRMAGCAGLRANDEGVYAGKVGTLCLNGTFDFEQNFNGHGVSNCSIAIHDPLPPPAE
jgi:hypothetical protein